MEKAGIKVILSSTSIINKWEEPSCSDLPQLVSSIRNVKQSVNDYLTDLVNKEKGFVSKSQKDAENSNDDDEEEEDDAEDTISGFIKEAVVCEEMKKSHKRKVQGGAKSQRTKKKK